LKSILDKGFKYVPSDKTDLKKTFDRIRKQQQQIRQEQKDKVKTINWRTA
jgi:hypothetical protein